MSKNTEYFYILSINLVNKDVIICFRYNLHSTSRGRLLCRGCGKFYITIGDLLDHHSKCRKIELKSQCDICQEKFFTEDFLKHHWLAVHTTKTLDTYQCKLCGSVNKMYKMLQHFLGAHSLMEALKCEECDSTFNDETGLMSHMKKHMPDRYKYECGECERKFAVAYALAAHVDSVHKGVTYDCDVCGKKFRQRRSLNDHKVRHEPDYVPPVLACNICNKKFATSSGLRGHVEITHKKNVFICSICGKSLCSKMSLENHMNLHQEKKPFVCDVCGKRFRTMYLLKTHTVVHTKKKSFKCDSCEKSFTQRSPLTIHIRRVHKNETPHECAVCQRRFVVKAQLNTHMKLHTGKNMDK